MSAPTPQRRPIAGFTGRTWVFKKVDEWLGSTGPPVFLVTGLQGTGKSTLAERFAQLSRGDVAADGNRGGKGFLTYAHFCKGEDRATLLPDRFIDRLSAAVIERHEIARKFIDERVGGNQEITLNAQLNVTGSIEPGATVKNLEVNILAGENSSLIQFDQLVRQPIEYVAAKDPAAQFVILVDGLDEALPIGDLTILTLLRDIRNFPPQVRWLITCRPDSRILDVFGRPAVELRGEDHQNDLYDFAYESLDGFEETLRISRARSIAKKEDFLYARCLLEDEKLVASLAGSKQEPDLPDRIFDLYRASLLKHGLEPGTPSWHERYQPLLGTIASSFGQGLPASQLASITGIPPSKADPALAVCRLFCQDSQPESPYQIDNAFREFLKTDAKYRVYADEATANIARFLYNRYKGQWLACEDLYALKFLPLHLLTAIEAKSSELECRRMLLELMTDLSYLGRSGKAGNLAAIDEALSVTQKIVPAAEASLLPRLLRVLQPEMFALKRWSQAAAENRLLLPDSYFWQQIRNRAFGFGFQNLVDAADKILHQIGQPCLLEHWPAKAAPAAGLGMLLTSFGSKASISSLLVIENPRLVAAGLRSGEIRLFDLSSGTPSGVLSGHNSKILALRFCVDRLYSVCSSGWIISWKIQTREMIRKRQLPKVRELRAAAIASVARRLLACTDQGELLLSGLDNPSRPRRLGKTTISGRLAITDDARFTLSTDGRTKLSIWYLRAGKKQDVKLPELPNATGFLDALSGLFSGRIDAVFTRDESRALLTQVSGDRCALLLCDLQSGEIIFRKAYTDRVLNLPVDLGNEVFAFVRNTFVLDICGKEDDKPTAGVSLHSFIDHIVPTKDGRSIVVGDRQGYVRAFRYVAKV